MTYDPSRPAAYFDEFGAREWTRFDEGGRSSPVSLEVHRHYLHRFVRSGDRVLDIGAGPGRFTIELAEIGARVVAADISKVQLRHNEENVRAAGVESAVLDRVVADVTDLSTFADGEFDAAVCYGGPLSYALDRAGEGVDELLRVTRPGGHVLVSAMSLVGAFSEELRIVLELPLEVNDRIVSTGFLDATGGGHVEMRLFRWPELEKLFLERGCAIVAASASNMNTAVEQELFPKLDAAMREALVRWEIDLGADPGAVARAPHIIVVVRKDDSV
jgi:SAM-dependent methyltransferase